jgi:Zn-dependent M32 family carboxypeptidase
MMMTSSSSLASFNSSASSRKRYAEENAKRQKEFEDKKRAELRAIEQEIASKAPEPEQLEALNDVATKVLDVLERSQKVDDARTAKAESLASLELPQSVCTADWLNGLDTKDDWRDNEKVAREVADYNRRVAKVQTLEADLKDKQAANQGNPDAATAVKAAFNKLNSNIDKRTKCRDKCKALFAKHFPELSTEQVAAAMGA